MKLGKIKEVDIRSVWAHELHKRAKKKLDEILKDRS